MGCHCPVLVLAEHKLYFSKLFFSTPLYFSKVEWSWQKTWCVQCLFWPGEVAEVIRSSHHQWTPKHQMVDTKHIPSKRFHQLVTLLGRTTTDMVEWKEKCQTVDTLNTKTPTCRTLDMDTKWWKRGHQSTRHIPRRLSHQTPTRYFVIWPFKECFLSNFTSFWIPFLAFPQDMSKRKGMLPSYHFHVWT